MNWRWMKMIILAIIGGGGTLIIEIIAIIANVANIGIASVILLPLIWAVAINYLYWGYKAASSFIPRFGWGLLRWFICYIIGCFAGIVAFPKAINDAIKDKE